MNNQHLNVNISTIAHHILLSVFLKGIGVRVRRPRTREETFLSNIPSSIADYGRKRQPYQVVLYSIF